MMRRKTRLPILERKNIVASLVQRAKRKTPAVAGGRFEIGGSKTDQAATVTTLSDGSRST